MATPSENDNKTTAEQQQEQDDSEFNFVHKSPLMRIAIFGMSELINTRLSDEALELCLEMLELGVHPRALADVVLHMMEVKERYADKSYK